MQNYITVLMARDVIWHPRGYYQLACSLARYWSTHLIGRPMPPLYIEGPLHKELDQNCLASLVAPPALPPHLSAAMLDEPWLSAYLKVLSGLRGWVLITESLSAALLGLFRRRRWIWDVRENHGANVRHDPAFRLRNKTLRYLIWFLARRSRPDAYNLTEYCYAHVFPLSRARFLPNAFVPVENASPLLPNLVKEYHLITGNLTESWGVWDALEEALEKPTTPLVIAGSIKTRVEEARLQSYLARHKAWLWLKSYFVPYPVVQNLQRHAGLLYGLYQPLPHIRDKIPGKFYEAAALGIPLRWRKGVSPIWDAFWQRYRHDPQAPMLYWSYYEPMLIEWVESLMAREKSGS